MTSFHKIPMAVAAAGNVQFVAAAEMGQQPAVLRPVPRMIAFKTVQLFVNQAGQVFLHAGAVKIAGKMGAKGNPSGLPDYLRHFRNCRKIRKPQIVFRCKNPTEKIVHITAQALVLQVCQRFPAPPVGVVGVFLKLFHGQGPAPVNQVADAVIIFLFQ